MANDLKKFRNGICGYAPQGSIGTSGKNGYSVHYSSFDSSEESIENMIMLIKKSKVLSTNPNYGTNQKISYKIGDTIITIDANMFIIDGESIDTCSLKLIGSIKIIENESGEGTDIFNGINVEYQLTSDTYSHNNDYNYITGGDVDHPYSPLYHHRDTNDSKCYGNYIQAQTSLSQYIPLMDGEFCTLVLNFHSGLRIEKILTVSNWNEKIFIDNRYFYPFGHSNDQTNYWNLPTYISDYNQEKAPGMSMGIKENIKTYIPNPDPETTDHNKCLCHGYLSFNVKDNEYRKKITISAG